MCGGGAIARLEATYALGLEVRIRVRLGVGTWLGLGLGLGWRSSFGFVWGYGRDGCQGQGDQPDGATS